MECSHYKMYICTGNMESGPNIFLCFIYTFILYFKYILYILVSYFDSLSFALWFKSLLPKNIGVMPPGRVLESDTMPEAY